MTKIAILAAVSAAAVFGPPLSGLGVSFAADTPARPPRPAEITVPPPGPFTFFVTSRTPGKGGNLGGLEGADAHCQALAASVGAGKRTWHAYLSAQPANGRPAVHARDRIGKGPWYNVKGDVIAMDVAELHGDVLRDRNQINKVYALDEKGEMVSGMGDKEIHHNILTGSMPDGRAWPPFTYDTTCRNWTSDAVEDSATVGHHDRTGLNTSWNSAHPTLGCEQQALNNGYGGMLYCFAID